MLMSLHEISSKLALSLPETSCSQPFGEGCDVFKVMDKMFALASTHEGKAMVNLKVEPEHGVMLRDTYPFIQEGYYMNKQHWVSVYENDDLDQDLLHDLILSSYELVVSKLKKADRLRIEQLKGD